jgi:glycosyltransferase involved in cell wall biosynthesis
MSSSLVSCAMPTFNRRRFVPEAIECYQAQTYPYRELVIVDDGTDPVADLVPDDPTIRYLRLDGRLSTGAKRNAACRAARGEIIVHWDDDDWSSPDRVEVQVAALLETGADLCGLRDLLFYEPSTDRGWRYRYPARARPWVAGGTMCYPRSVWEAQGFADVRQGEDTQFVWGHRSLRVHTIDRTDLYIATVHAANTSAKRTVGPRWTSISGAEIRAIRGSQSLTPQAQTKEDATMGSTTTTAPARRAATSPNTAVSHVTVSIPHRGPGDLLRAAVDSILGQTHRHLTCVVVFDGDRTGAKAIDDIDDPRLVRHVLAKNHGRYFADQVVLEATASEYFLVQDSDDWSEPTRIERLLAELGRTGADVCVSDVVHHDRRSGHEETSRHTWTHLNDPIGPRLFHRAGHQGLYRTAILRSIGGWYAGHRIAFDTSVLNLVLMAGGRVVLLPEPLYHRNIRNGSLSMSPSTGWNTPERRRVIGELRTLHQRMYVATGAGTAPNAGSIIRENVLAARTGAATAALGREADQLRQALPPIPNGVRRPQAAGMQPIVVRTRIPDVHQVLARHGAANPHWSISPMAALELYRRLTTHRPRRILDVGSGLSTVVEALAAARSGGRVVSLEHDPRYAERTRALLRESGVDDVAEVVVAPLAELSHPCGTGPWYQGQPVGTFDFIVVDGPPLGAGGRMAVLPALAEHRRRSWELWLFDAHRPDEQRCLSAWAEHFRFDLSVERIDPTGVAVLRKAGPGVPAPVLERLGISLLTGGRPDLLERTLTTLAARWPDQVRAAYVVALVNGPDPASRDLLGPAGWINRILTYEGDVLTIGMATSIVTAAVTGHPEVEHLLHLEDDWETRTVDMEALVRAASFLRDPGVGQVRLRHRTEPCLSKHMISGRTIGWRQGDDHRRGLAHFTFNPSLVSRDVADRVYPAVDERDAQRRFLATGLDVVQLEPGAFAHIGDRSRRLQIGRRR